MEDVKIGTEVTGSARRHEEVLAGGAALVTMGGAATVTLCVIALAGAAPREVSGAARKIAAGGASVEMIGGAAGVALGILAVIGFAPLALCGIAALVLGGSVLLSAILPARPGVFGMHEEAARRAAESAGGVQALAGLGAVTLAILALAGILSRELTIIALLGVGAAAMLSGGALLAGSAISARSHEA
jgi:hypothetical protein